MFFSNCITVHVLSDDGNYPIMINSLINMDFP